MSNTTPRVSVGSGSNGTAPSNNGDGASNGDSSGKGAGSKYCPSSNLKKPDRLPLANKPASQGPDLQGSYIRGGPLTTEVKDSNGAVHVENFPPHIQKMLSEVERTNKSGFDPRATRLNFYEYLALTEMGYLTGEFPAKPLRPVTQFTADGIDYADDIVYGEGVRPTTKAFGEDLRKFAFLTSPQVDPRNKNREVFYGHPEFWDDFYGSLRMQEKNGVSNRASLIHGPHGSGKSLGFRALLRWLEYYSRQDHGAMFKSSIVIDKKSPRWWWHGKDKYVPVGKISKRLDSQNNANPLFMLEPDDRIALLDGLGVEPDKHYHFGYVHSMRPDPMTEGVYRALRDGVYEGDEFRATRHIQCVRRPMVFGKDLQLTQSDPLTLARLISVDSAKEFEGVPDPFRAELQALKLFETSGPLAMANHGFIFVDEFGRDVSKQVLNAYLTLFEYGMATVTSDDRFSEDILNSTQFYDILFVLATNPDVLESLQKAHPPEFNALIKTRTNPMQLGYERNYIYTAELIGSKLDMLSPESDGVHITPETVDCAARWLTSTVLSPSVDRTHYFGKEVVAKTLRDPLVQLLFGLEGRKRPTMAEKVRIFALENLIARELDQPAKYSVDDQQLVHRYAPHISREMNGGRFDFDGYEGSKGVDPRRGAEIIEHALKHRTGECLTPMDVFEATDAFIDSNPEYNTGRKTDTSRTKRREPDESDQTTSSHGIYGGMYGGNKPKPQGLRDLKQQEEDIYKLGVRYQVFVTTKAIKPEEEMKFEIAKYIAHVIGSYVPDAPAASGLGGARGVTEERFQDPPFVQKTKKDTPNDPMMRATEKTLGIAGDDEETRTWFRKEMYTEIMAWINENGSGSEVYNRLFEIPAVDWVRVRYEQNYVSQNKSKVSLFIDDLKICNQHGITPEKIEAHIEAKYPEGPPIDETSRLRTLTDETSEPPEDPRLIKVFGDKYDKERLQILIDGMRGLEEACYCPKCRDRVIDFAFRGYNFGNVGEAIKELKAPEEALVNIRQKQDA